MYRLLLFLLAAPALAQSIPPPAGQRVLETVTGTGVQIYRCDQKSPAPDWVFLAPEATLTSAGKQVGTHGAGPVWRYGDGSAIRGEVMTKQASLDPQAIPWLLLRQVEVLAPGRLSQVTYIARTDTRGGVAPPAGCDAAHLGAMVRVPYTALYTFYVTAVMSSEVVFPTLLR